MGILNITPDSFSDGGLFLRGENALSHALSMVKDGADIIDIGGESSRPGADSLDEETELARVIPVIESIRKESEIVISVDTMKPVVAEKAIESGANIINDISGFRQGAMVDVAVKHQTPVIVMHMQGEPATMQINPEYRDVVEDVRSYLDTRTKEIVDKGIQRKNIIIDPGIGFGKSVEDNFTLIRGMTRFVDLGYPVLMGPSRKSFIGQTLGLPVEDRLEGTLAAITACVMNGAKILRVHDVKENHRAIQLASHFI